MKDKKMKSKKKIYHPDFNDWIKSENGLEAMRWPVPTEKYLMNRLFWAFEAGYAHAASVVDHKEIKV